MSNTVSGVIYSSSEGEIKQCDGVIGKDIVRLARNGETIVALCTDGVYCVHSGKQVFQTEFINICGGKTNSVAITQNGSMYAWGIGEKGEIGLGSARRRVETPIQMKLENIKSIASGYYHSLALDTNGNVFAWGQNFEMQLGIYKNGKEKLKEKGGLVEDLSFVPRLIPFSHQIPIKDISCGSNFSVLLTRDGEVWTCGSNECGQLGQGNLKRKDCFVKVSFDNKNNLTLLNKNNNRNENENIENKIENSSDDNNIVEDNTNNDNNINEGNDDDNKPESNTEEIILEKSIVKISKIASGYAHTVCITEDGEIFSFGLNSHGQLGLNDFKSKTTPHLIKNEESIKWKDIFADGNSTCGITEKGELFSWGSNKNNRLFQKSVVNSNFTNPTRSEYLKGQIVGKFTFGLTTSAVCVISELKNIHPDCGPKSGGQVELSGYGLWDNGNVIVKFELANNANDENSKIKVECKGKMSKRHIICETLPIFKECGKYLISLSLDGKIFLPQTKEYFVHPCLTILPPEPSIVNRREVDIVKYSIPIIFNLHETSEVIHLFERNICVKIALVSSSQNMMSNNLENNLIFVRDGKVVGVSNENENKSYKLEFEINFHKNTNKLLCQAGAYYLFISASINHQDFCEFHQASTNSFLLTHTSTIDYISPDCVLNSIKIVHTETTNSNHNETQKSLKTGSNLKNKNNSPAPPVEPEKVIDVVVPLNRSTLTLCSNNILDLTTLPHGTHVEIEYTAQPLRNRPAVRIRQLCQPTILDSSDISFINLNRLPPTIDDFMTKVMFDLLTTSNKHSNNSSISIPSVLRVNVKIFIVFSLTNKLIQQENDEIEKELNEDKAREASNQIEDTELYNSFMNNTSDDIIVSARESQLSEEDKKKEKEDKFNEKLKERENERCKANEERKKYREKIKEERLLNDESLIRKVLETNEKSFVIYTPHTLTITPRIVTLSEKGIMLAVKGLKYIPKTGCLIALSAPELNFYKEVQTSFGNVFSDKLKSASQIETLTQNQSDAEEFSEEQEMTFMITSEEFKEHPNIETVDVCLLIDSLSPWLKNPLMSISLTKEISISGVGKGKQGGNIVFGLQGFAVPSGLEEIDAVVRVCEVIPGNPLPLSARLAMEEAGEEIDENRENQVLDLHGKVVVETSKSKVPVSSIKLNFTVPTIEELTEAGVVYTPKVKVIEPVEVEKINEKDKKAEKGNDKNSKTKKDKIQESSAPLTPPPPKLRIPESYFVGVSLDGGVSFHYSEKSILKLK